MPPWKIGSTAQTEIHPVTYQQKCKFPAVMRQ
jgi:hypothetical protein